LALLNHSACSIKNLNNYQFLLFEMKRFIAYFDFLGFKKFIQILIVLISQIPLFSGPMMIPKLH